MKKTIFAIAAACAATACLSACNLSCDGNKPSYNYYDAINDMLNASYSKIDISVTNTFDTDTELVSTYEMIYAGDEITVNYSIERFTGISLDTAGTEKSVTTGTASIKNGAVVSDDKQMLEVIPGTKFSFKAEYFTNVNEDIIDMMFQADVLNPSGFMGTEIKCTDMKVNAEYLNVFSEMEVTYTGDAGNSVKIVYNFTV